MSTVYYGYYTQYNHFVVGHVETDLNGCKMVVVDDEFYDFKEAKEKYPTLRCASQKNRVP